MKICNICKINKPRSEYWVRNKDKGWIYSPCKLCMLEQNKKFKRNNPDKIKSTKKKEYTKNKAKYLKRARKNQLFSKYGIDKEYYDNLLISQEGKCKICRKDQSDLSKKLFIDHCHKTGKIRGLLCMFCNCMLGFAKDDKEILLSAINYLKHRN